MSIRYNLLYLFFRFDQHLSPVIEITFMPVCTVPVVWFTCLLTLHHVWRGRILVSTTFSFALLRDPTFRMCHDPKTFNSSIQCLSMRLERDSPHRQLFPPVKVAQELSCHKVDFLLIRNRMCAEPEWSAR